MQLRVIEEDLEDPAFLRHFDELELTEAQAEGLKKVLINITKPLEELISESRARRTPQEGAARGPQAATSHDGADRAAGTPKAPSPVCAPAPPAPPAPKRVLVTANFGRGDRQDFRSYFASSIAEPSKLDEFRESVKAHLSVCGLQGPIDDNELSIELKPGLSYRKSMGRLVAGMPLCPGSEAMDGFEVLVRYVGSAPAQPT